MEVYVMYSFGKIENKRCHSNIKSHEHYKLVTFSATCVDITEYGCTYIYVQYMKLGVWTAQLRKERTLQKRTCD